MFAPHMLGYPGREAERQNENPNQNPTSYRFVCEKQYKPIYLYATGSADGFV
jgi:hypothetical protein